MRVEIDYTHHRPLVTVTAPDGRTLTQHAVTRWSTSSTVASLKAWLRQPVDAARNVR